MSTEDNEPTRAQYTGEEHRDSPRVRRYEAARLIFNGDRSVVDCMLRDISDSGARVRLKSLFDGPKQIVLEVIDDFKRSADVMWYQNNELGLRFQGEV